MSYFQSINPATGGIVWEGKTSSKKSVDKAIARARKAFNESLNDDPRMRPIMIEDCCDRFVTIVEKRKERLAQAIHDEMGKPMWEARTEVGAVIGKLKHSQKARKERTANVSEPMGGNKFSNVRHRPLGVVGVIGPFNFPAHLPNGHIIPALLAGNTIVFKPSEQTPLVGELMCKYWEEAGLPDGVLNLVQGKKKTGEALVDGDIDGLFFTGSYNVGSKIHKRIGPSKMLALEMGGNNPLIVYGASNLEAAAYTTIMSAFITSGQRCVCARRLILIDNDESKKFLEVLIKMTKKIKIGTGNDCFMGPMVSEDAARSFNTNCLNLISAGGKYLYEDQFIPYCDSISPAIVSPEIIDVTDIKDRKDVEIFGPLLQVIRVKSWVEAIDEANNTDYGLSAGLICDDVNYWESFMLRSRAGIVNWNTQITGALGSNPFGGIGKSGNHRPSAYYACDYCSYPMASVEDHDNYVPTKTVTGIDLEYLEGD